MGNRNYSLVSLFCGAGGLDMGFDRCGIKTIWANDFNEDACETHKMWSHAKVVSGDIGSVDFSSIPDSDVITGGFPCQGFSLAGPRKIDDSRNILYRYFVKLVDLKKPKVFVAENVKGLLTLGNGDIVEAIIEDFASKGYTVKYKLLNAADYGVPQDRNRVIIVGVRNDLNVSFEYPKASKKRTTMREALRDIDEPAMTDVCTAPFSSRYMSRNRKRGWDEVSFTIPAMAKQVSLWPGSPDMEKISTDLWSFGKAGVTRRLSYQEAAAIQTFPKEMVFIGNLDSKYRQIGNAVPVKLAEAVAKNILALLDEIN